MILPSCFIFECVKYGKRGWSQSQREPDRRRPLAIRELEALLQERGDLIFLAAASFAFFLWLQSEEQAQRLRESRQR